MHPASRTALRNSLAVYEPPARTPPSKWMETGYVVSAEESAEPGLYSFDRYAYLREIFDSFVDPDVEMVVVPKAAQTGWTTGFTGFVGSVIANDPCRILIAMPTQDEAEIWSKDRFEPNLAVTPALRSKIKPAKSRDGNNKILHKRFPGGSVKIVGANSSTGLSSWPAKFAMCDEVDRYPLSAGGEGDPIALVRKRLQTWLRRGSTLGLGSTPKVEQTSIIWHYYLLGDQRRWFAPCPRCKAEHAIDWDHIKWAPGPAGGGRLRLPGQRLRLDRPRPAPGRLAGPVAGHRRVQGPEDPLGLGPGPALAARHGQYENGRLTITALVDVGPQSHEGRVPGDGVARR
jgi:phage terminase large subunit GpA-like protein